MAAIFYAFSSSDQETCVILDSSLLSKTQFIKSYFLIGHFLISILINAKKLRKTIEWERLEIFSRKLETPGNSEEADIERFYEDIQDLLELTPKKDVLFIIGDLNAKLGSQETPGVTGKLGLGVRNEAWQRLIVLPREHTGHSKHAFPQEETLHMDIKRWSIQKSD